MGGRSWMLSDRRVGLLLRDRKKVVPIPVCGRHIFVRC